MNRGAPYPKAIQVQCDACHKLVPVSHNRTLVQTGLSICKGIPGLTGHAGHELEPVSQIWTLVQIGLARLKGKPVGLHLPTIYHQKDKPMHCTNRIHGVWKGGKALSFPIPNV